MNKTTRVIGIGSPVAGDEVGMRLVERLRDDPQWRERGEIEWLLLERPGAALLHYFGDVETVVLIDALEGAGAEEMVCIDPDELLQAGEEFSTHHFGVAQALRLAATLGQLPPRLFIYGVRPNKPQWLDSVYRNLSGLLTEGLASGR